MKKEFRKVLQDLLRRQRIPRAIKEKHYDIEDAIAARGGDRGGMSHAD